MFRFKGRGLGYRDITQRQRTPTKGPFQGVVLFGAFLGRHVA